MKASPYMLDRRGGPSRLRPRVTPPWPSPNRTRTSWGAATAIAAPHFFPHRMAGRSA